MKIASTPGFPGPINQVTALHPVWDLYLIKGAQLVTPLDHLPVVETGSSANEWLDTNLSWWESEANWSVELALNGPPNLAESHGRERSFRHGWEYLSLPRRWQTCARRTPRSASTSGRLGAPVLVKVPYFPNWHASGALGPYEVSPNLMAVVPTAHHVTLTYGTTPADQLGKLASLMGVVGLGMLVTLRPPAMKQIGGTPEQRPAPAPDDELEPGVPGLFEDESEQEARVTVDDIYGPPVPPPDPLTPADPLVAAQGTMSGQDRGMTSNFD